jgi:hypothetical protein
MLGTAGTALGYSVLAPGFGGFLIGKCGTKVDGAVDFYLRWFETFPLNGF